jgi:hypothetical protein
MLRINKIQCLLLGLGVIFLFYFLNRLNHILSSEKVNGTMVFYVEDNDSLEGKLFYPVIEFKYKDSLYRFQGAEGSSYEINESIPVLLKQDDPERPLLFTLQSFWLYPLFYVILPVMLWAAFSLSYVNKNEVVEINLKYPFFKKKKKSGELEKTG